MDRQRKQQLGAEEPPTAACDGTGNGSSCSASSSDAEPAPSPFEQLRALLPDALSAHVSEDHVQSVLSLRRGREALFGRHLFSDPAWDVLLELYAAELGGRGMSICELGRALDTPESVIARWTAALIDAGVVVLNVDRDKTQTAKLGLSEGGAAKMRQLIEKWGCAFLAI